MLVSLPGPDRKIRDRSVEIFTFGSGAPLLFLHSAIGVESSFPMIERLAKHYQVIAPSHPGFGNSELPRWFRTVDDLAYHYLDLMEELALTDTVVVGSCFGGWLAAETAVKNLSRMRKLVLIGALGAKFGAPDATEITDVFRDTYQDVRKHYFRDGRPDERDFAKLSAHEVNRFVRNREALTLFGWAPLLHNPTLRPWLRRIAIPTLVLWGAEDRVANADYGRAYAAAIPSARFETVSEGGHLVQDEKPDEVADRILAFARA
jgi:pimeloyl-ACP methyl ester carboxylesterase